MFIGRDGKVISKQFVSHSKPGDTNDRTLSVMLSMSFRKIEESKRRGRGRGTFVPHQQMAEQ
jgi:hypothetical protein